MKIYLFDNQHKIYTRKNPAKKQPCFSGENTKHANNQSISNIVNGYFALNRQPIIQTITQCSFEDFKQRTQKMLADSSALCDSKTKVKILDQIASAYSVTPSRINPYHSYSYKHSIYRTDTRGARDGEYYTDHEKAMIITALKMKEIYDDQNLSNTQKRQQILEKENLKKLEDFFKGPNREGSWNYVMKVLSEIGYKEFVPYAEIICYANKQNYMSYFENTYTKERPKYLTYAKELINKNYDLNKLKDFQSKEEYYHYGAIRALEEWGLPEHVKLLEPYLNSKNPRIVALAIRAIGCIGENKNVNSVKPFVKSQNPNIVSESILAIAKLGKKDDFDLIRNIALDERYNKKITDWTCVPLACSYAIEKIGNESDFGILIKYLNYQQSGVRSSAYKALGRSNNPKYVPYIKSALSKEKLFRDSEPSGHFALGELGDIDSLEFLLKSLPRMLKNNDPYWTTNEQDAYFKAVTKLAIKTKTEKQVLRNILKDAPKCVCDLILNLCYKSHTDEAVKLFRDIANGDFKMKNNPNPSSYMIEHVMDMKKRNHFDDAFCIQFKTTGNSLRWFDSDEIKRELENSYKWMQESKDYYNSGYEQCAMLYGAFCNSKDEANYFSSNSVSKLKSDGKDYKIMLGSTAFAKIFIRGDLTWSK